MDTGERPPGRVEFFLVAADDDDRVTTGQELSGQFEADAARAASDQDSSLREFHG
jgi:hypothetical protein